MLTFAFYSEIVEKPFSHGQLIFWSNNPKRDRSRGYAPQYARGSFVDCCIEQTFLRWTREQRHREGGNVDQLLLLPNKI